MLNTLPASEIKRRGLAAIEEGLRHGPVHILKRNKPTAVVLSEADYRRLVGDRPAGHPGMTALQWLLAQPVAGTRDKADIDAALADQRDW
jgi:hypothetical protein